jgi:hypothetical protein
MLDLLYVPILTAVAVLSLGLIVFLEYVTAGRSVPPNSLESSLPKRADAV